MSQPPRYSRRAPLAATSTNPTGTGTYSVAPVIPASVAPVIPAHQNKSKISEVLKLLKNLPLRTLNKRILLHAPEVTETISEYTGSTSGVLPGPADSVELVASLTKTMEHKPTLDIDLPCTLEPSCTEGKYHLFIDIALSEEKYTKLLDILYECGIIEWGIKNQLREHGYTSVRLPGVQKMFPDGTVAVKPGSFIEDSGPTPVQLQKIQEEILKEI